MNVRITHGAPEKKHGVCPWWVAYLFDNPLRRMIHPAGKILVPYVTEGMTVLDFGCGFGHYTIGMAQLTGPSGQVLAADIQQKMLDKTMARAAKAGLAAGVRPLLCKGADIGIPSRLDFALASNSIHETPDPSAILAQLFGALKPCGRFLLMEPRSHMKPDEFEAEVTLAVSAGFLEEDRPKVTRQLSVLFRRPAPEPTM